MLRKVLFLAVTAAMFLFCYQAEATQISVSWDGGGDGHSWADPCNWNPNIVPDNNETNSFIVTIDSNNIGVDEVLIFLGQSYVMDQLDCNGIVELGKVAFGSIELTLVFPNGLTNHGELEIWNEGFQMVIDGNVTNYGSMEIECDIQGDVTNKIGATLEFWEHLNIYGNLYNEDSATLLFDDEDVDIEGDGVGVSKIENEGTIICQRDPGGPGEEDLFENRGSIHLFGGSCSTEETFDNDTTGQIEGWGAIRAWGNSGYQIIQNKGDIQASSGVLLLWSNDSIENTGTLGNKPLSSIRVKTIEDVNNKGTIQVNVDGGITFDCNLVNDNNGIIELYGGTLAAKSITQTKDANKFAGFGSITGDLFIDPNGLIELTGPTNIVGDVNIPAGATLEISDGQTLITGHTTCNGTIQLIGGTVIFQGGCDCTDCNITHNPGTDRNHFDINSSGIVNLEDFAAFAESWLWQATWY